MKFLITGGAGFIGSNLCDFLIREGHDLVILDDLSSGRKENLNNILKKITFHNAKIEEFKFSEKDYDAVVHLAAQASVPVSIEDFRNSSYSNLIGTIKIIDFCNLNNLPLVYASSSAIYGNLPLGNDEAESNDLLSPYAVDKLSMELYTKMSNVIFGLSSLGLRFFNVYGQRQDPSSPYSGVISIFIDRIQKNLPITIYGGNQTRDFIYVEDVVECIWKAINLVISKNICERINVLTGISTSIEELSDYLFEILSVRVKKEYKELLPSDPLESNGTTDKMVKILKTDISKFKLLNEGLKLTIDLT